MANPYKELRLAIEAGDCPKTKKHLDNGIPATIEHFVIATPNRDYAILELFVSHGWDINTDVNDFIPSALVYTFEDKKLLEWFLNHSADPNKTCRIRDCTPLSYAVKDAPHEIIQLSLSKGGQIHHG
ncbi:hypothetical protein APSETT444_003408 [Aspergillus pseudonomiae]